MRRISLAVALIGAVAAAGCGGGAKPSSSDGSKGTAGVNFTVTINNQGPGTVSDGTKTCAADTTCTWTYASGTTVALAATATGSNFFNGFFGACSGLSCTVTGDADQYVVSYFSATPQAHENWAGGHPDPAFSALQCSLCHPASGTATGIAPSCTSCHPGIKPIADGPGEKCLSCHIGTGSAHQARYNAFADGLKPATTKFAVTNVSFASAASATPGKFKATVTFTLKKGGVPFTAAISGLKQKTLYFVAYDAANKKFPTPSYKQTADVDPDGTKGGSNTESVNFSLSGWTLVDAATGTWTAVKDLLPTDPALLPNSFVYGYFGDANLPFDANNNTARHYALMDNMVSFSKVVNGTIGYTSAATVSGCEKCHGAPYSKHGYRQATVAGLNDFVACKACHTDFRRGTDAPWYLLVDDIAYAASGAALTDAQKLKYAYTANVMQDTHNSHAMEFAYPQSPANCTICHEGKLNLILTDANFVGTVCKSCHATTATVDPGGEKAPSFAGPVLGPKLQYHTFNWVDQYDASHNLIAPAGTVKETVGGVDYYYACNACHADNADVSAFGGTNTPNDGMGPMMFGAQVPLFKDIHNGYNAAIYTAAGAKYSATAKMQIDGITVDKAAKKVTVNFSVVGAPAGATVVPTVVGSIYGYNTKDFIVSGHGSTGTPSARILEYAAGSATTCPRLTITGTGPWTAVADLSSATVFPTIADGSSTKMELGILPAVTLADGTTSIAISGLTATIDLTANGTTTPVANQYGKNIVDAAKCNKCHEALGTTFHSPSYGSAGVVGCRLCHVVGSGGSHLEMQSRSIDSYVHAIHSYQYFDIKSVVFTDAVAKFKYAEHIDSVYPNFSIENCESCHYPGTYDVPVQNKSLPSVLSASASTATQIIKLDGVNARNIGTVASVVVGPGSRACGSCHRAKLINEDDATGLTALDSHVGGTINTTTGIVTGNGYRAASPETLSTVVAGLKAAGLLP